METIHDNLLIKKNKITPINLTECPKSKNGLERAETMRMESPDTFSNTLEMVNEMTNNKHLFQERSKSLEKTLLLKINELENRIQFHQGKIKSYRGSITKYNKLIEKNNEEQERSLVCNIL